MQTTEQQAVLSVSGVGKHLGSRKILEGVTFDVYPGEIFGFLGPNGSGKTTTIKLILGLLRMEEGKIEICGKNVNTQYEEAVARVGGIIENPEVYRFLTGMQNLEQYARMYSPASSHARIERLVELVGLSGRIRDKVAKYSLGMRQRLGLAQALLNSPKLLVLDEPTNGLDPEGIHDLRNILKRIAHEEGSAVLVSSHLLSEMDLMCDRVGIIDKGRVVGIHSMDEIRSKTGDDTHEQFLIAVSDPTAAIDALAALSDCKAEAAVGGVAVTVATGGLSAVTKALVLAGVAFGTVTEAKRSLEEAFLDLMQSVDDNAVRHGNQEKGGDA